MFGKADLFRGVLQMTNQSWISRCHGTHRGGIRKVKGNLGTWEIAGWVENTRALQARGICDRCRLPYLVNTTGHSVGSTVGYRRLTPELARRRLAFDGVRVQLVLVGRKRAFDAIPPAFGGVGGELVSHLARPAISAHSRSTTCHSRHCRRSCWSSSDAPFVAWRRGKR